MKRVIWNLLAAICLLISLRLLAVQVFDIGWHIAHVTIGRLAAGVVVQHVRINLVIARSDKGGSYAWEWQFYPEDVSPSRFTERHLGDTLGIICYGMDVNGVPKVTVSHLWARAEVFGLMILLVPLLRLLVIIRHRRRPGHCIHCGYDLRASRERCPECGAAFDPPTTV